jgi:hypothetical protein
MGKPASGILRRNHRERLGNGLVQGITRAAFARNRALNFDQHFSIGDKSGEYGGK